MCRIVVLHSTACCSLTDLCDAVPQTAGFWLKVNAYESMLAARQRVQAAARTSWRLAHCKQVETVAQRGRCCARRSPPPGGAHVET